MPQTNRITPKMAAFCDAYIECGNQTEAYKRAYNTQNQTEQTIYSNASRLMNHSKVAARLDEVREAVAAKSACTLDSIIAELDEARALAITNGQTGPAIQASKIKADLLGIGNQGKAADTNVTVNLADMRPVKDESKAAQQAWIDENHTDNNPSKHSTTH